MLLKLVVFFYTIQISAQMQLHVKNLNLTEGDIEALLARYSAPQVQLPLGVIAGSVSVTNRLVLYNKFEGVPYALPPVGNHRFKRPYPVQRWDGVWIAKTMHKCLQSQPDSEENGIIGSEDCLYMNIYVPAAEGQQYDVLVNIHGGGFLYGYGGQTSPDNFIDNNILYITFNYRLGPFGFLSTEDGVVPGNNGLKDQMMALQFIVENIAAFGGNPQSITLMGSSAGGASVNFHYFSNVTAPLFQRGISQSGTLLNPWVITKNPLTKTRILAENLGCFSNISRVMVRCLRQRSGRQILTQLKSLQRPWWYRAFSPFALVVDTWAPVPVLPAHPYQMMKKNLKVEKPWIVSFTDSDGLYPGAFFYKDETLKTLNTYWNQIAPRILHYDTAFRKNQNLISQKIRQHSFQAATISKKNFKQFISLMSYRLYQQGIEKAVRMQATKMWSPVYMYQYSHQAAYGREGTWIGNKKLFGATLGDDTDMICNPNIDFTNTWNDLEMHLVMLDLVVTFVKTMKPTVPEEWPRVFRRSPNLNYLVIGGPQDLSMVESEMPQEKFWKSLPILENEKLFGNFTSSTD